MDKTYYQIQWFKFNWYNREGLFTTLEAAQTALYNAWDFFNGAYECRIVKIQQEVVQTLPTKEVFYAKV